MKYSLSLDKYEIPSLVHKQKDPVLALNMMAGDHSGRLIVRNQESFYVAF